MLAVTVIPLVSHVLFRAMFTGELAESRQTEVVIRDIDERAMELLIDFAYTSQVTAVAVNSGHIWHWGLVCRVCSNTKCPMSMKMRKSNHIDHKHAVSRFSDCLTYSPSCAHQIYMHALHDGSCRRQ